MRKTVRHARQFHTRLAPLFPRYLFVEIAIGRDQWTSIRGTFGVSHLLMDGEQPRAVPFGVIEALLAMSDATGLITLDATLRPGQPVRITTGPFAGLVGELASLDDDGRVRVLLDVLGTDVLVSAVRVGLVPAA
jgi:transcriptional antiterminator RfaH